MDPVNPSEIPITAYNEKETPRGFVSPTTFFRLFTHIQMMPILESGEETLVGGQAVMEGVMMRAPHSYCVAVRKPDGRSSPRRCRWRGCRRSTRFSSLPVFRGLGTLYQAMAGREGAEVLGRGGAGRIRKRRLRKSPRKCPAGRWRANLIFSLAFFIFLYKFVPLYLVDQAAAMSIPALERPHRLQRDRRRDPHG